MNASTGTASRTRTAPRSVPARPLTDLPVVPRHEHDTPAEATP